ncbi:MAG: LacI family transcriptional regulator [Ruminococcaceae bacterium]|nr:LacI family transcriptional regulator [Oscillospiraceae bacterium]
MNKKTTIEDIAKICGVSKATVSYVLNGKKSAMKMSKDTVKEIIEVCQRLGYRPDKTAQALSAMRKIPLNLIILTPWLYSQYSDFMAQINSAFESISREKEIKFSYAYYERGSLSKHMKPEKYKKYDAVIIAGTSVDDDAYLERNSAYFDNIIMLNRCVKGVYSVYGNDREATFDLASRVKAKGHYDSFVIVGENTDSFCRVERYAALKEAFPDAVISEFEGNIDSENAKKLFEEHKKGKTCFAFTLFSPASLFLTHLLRQGVKIPLDCGIICFDIHTLLSDYLPLTLSTVDPKLSDMVQAAYGIALSLKEGAVPESKCIHAEIIEGETAKL